MRALPAISVIIASHNRCALLQQKLKSLAKQSLSFDAFEVIVCSSGSSDGTLAMLEEIALPYRLKVVAFEENRGAGAARNACVKEARGDILYFSDDDCLLLLETLAQHLEAQERRPSVVIGGILFEYEGERSKRQPQKVSYWQLNGANSSLPREAFVQVGGFDENLENYGLEDVLLGYKLFRAGLAFTALPDALVLHVGPDPLRSGNLAKAHSAGRNAARIASRYPELAFRLGVHRLLLLGKRFLFLPPIGPLWRAVDRLSFDYERAYLEGALAEGRKR